jgi:hypothetical protein
MASKDGADGNGFPAYMQADGNYLFIGTGNSGYLRCPGTHSILSLGPDGSPYAYRLSFVELSPQAGNSGAFEASSQVLIVTFSLSNQGEAGGAPSFGGAEPPDLRTIRKISLSKYMRRPSAWTQAAITINGREARPIK